MKKLLFLIALVCAVCAHAQLRMYEEGKSWRVNDYHFGNEGTKVYEFEYTVVGDTLINDTLAAVVRGECLNSSSGYSYSYVYEDGGQVYFYIKAMPGDYYNINDTIACFRPAYNFNWQVGDSICESYDVIAVNYMTIEGVSRKVLTLGYEGYPDCEYLIEGIGPTNWNELFGQIYIACVSTNYLGTELISCHKDGVCLFSKDRFDVQIKGTEGISSAAVEAADEAIYDLNGRLVQAPAKGQVYIRGGKKAVWK